jgi:DNA modification methylase
MADVRLLLGDCLERMGEIPDGSVDAVISDPIYPEIDRPYGRITEVAWHELMRGVVAHCRRVLKSKGSAVFILQPNSAKIGRTRTWLWDFLAWVGREWGVVEDVYWWNSAALPNAGCERKNGLLRRSVKTCVWCGPADCHRDQDAVLWEESDWNREQRARGRFGRKNTPSGNGRDRSTISGAAAERGGVTPFNLLIVPAVGHTNRGNHGHSAATPPDVCDWWVRYISPPGGVVLDSFAGSGTVLLAALKLGRSAVGIESHEPYFRIAERRIAKARAEMSLFATA